MKEIVKCLRDILPQSTSHGVGQKQVLLSRNETSSNITQIAITMLQPKEHVKPHVHPTMDEYYLFLSGKGCMTVGKEEVVCEEGLFLVIPAKEVHAIYAETEMKFIILGMAL